MKTLITPKKAKQILVSNTKNRKIKFRHVTFLANQMLSGCWVYNGQSIVVSNNGILVDGQHRLLAIIESGTTIETELIEGVDYDEAFSTIDTGVVRSPSDVLAMRGYRNAPLLAAAIKILITYDATTDKSGFAISGVKITNDNILDKTEKVLDLMGSEKLDVIFGNIQKYGGSSVDLFVAMVLYRNSRGKTMQFFNDISLGLFNNENDPLKRYREYIQSTKLKKRDAKEKTQTVSNLFKSWNLYNAGGTITFLRKSKFVTVPQF